MSEESACRFCGYVLLPGRKFCPHCGMEVQVAFKTLEEYEKEKRKLTTYITLLESKYLTRGISYSQYKIKKQEYSLRLADIEERITELKIQEGREAPKKEERRVEIEAPAGFFQKGVPQKFELSAQQKVTNKISEFLLMLENLYSELSKGTEEERRKMDSIASELSRFSHRLDRFRNLFAGSEKKT